MTEQLGTERPVQGNGQQPVAAQPVAAGAASAADHPEVPVAAAFAGGFLLAMIIKRLGR